MEEIPAGDWTAADIKTAVGFWAKLPAEQIAHVVIIVQPVESVQARIGLPIIHTYDSPDTVLWLLGQIMGAAGASVITDPSAIPRTECDMGHELDDDGTHKLINEVFEHNRELL